MSQKKPAVTKPGTVLGNLRDKHPRLKSPKRSTAAKFFQQAARPQTISHLGVSAKPRPLIQDLPRIDTDDPLLKIEESTNRIGKIMNDYEIEREDNDFKILQDLDSAYQINAFEPQQIIQESKKVVEGLISYDKELKDHQSDVLGSIYNWLHREESALRNQDDLRPILNQGRDTNATSEDLLGVLSSTEGSNQERISKAMNLHSDMMSKAFVVIRQLERKNEENESLIKDLNRQNEALRSKRVTRDKPRVAEQELKKQLEQAHHRISCLEETVRNQNTRIEELIGQNIIASARSQNSISEEEALMMQHDNIKNQIRVQELTDSLQSTQDELFKVKHKMLTVEAEKEFLETQAATLRELIEVEKAKADAAIRDCLIKLSEKNISCDDSERIHDLQSEIDKMRIEKENLKKELHDEMIKRVNTLRKEYEVREIEIKRRALNNTVNASTEEIIETMQKQHEAELEMVKQECNDEISSVRRSTSETIKRMENDHTKKINDMKQEMSEAIAKAAGLSGEEQLIILKKQFDEREIQLKAQYAAKVEMIRNEFTRSQRKLECELQKREDQVDKLVEIVDAQQVIDSRLPSPPPEPETENENETEEEEGTEYSVKVKQQIEEAVARYAKKMDARHERKLNEQKEKLDAYWQEYSDRISNELNEELELRTAEFSQTLETLNSELAELRAENELYKSGEKSYEETDSIEYERARRLDEEEAKIENLPEIEISRDSDITALLEKQSHEFVILQERLKQTESELSEMKQLRNVEIPVLPYHRTLELSNIIASSSDLTPVLLSRSTTNSVTIKGVVEAPTSPVNTTVTCLSVASQDALYIDTSAQTLTVSCQADLLPDQDTLGTQLIMQPPLEIFATLGVEIRPEAPPVLTPSEVLSKEEVIDEKKPSQLLTKTGELVTIPKIAEVTEETHPAASSVAVQMTIGETKQLTRRLQLVTSEIQSIGQETSKTKRMQLERTVGVTLDIEKDSVLSQMRERITELEQAIQRMEEKPVAHVRDEPPKTVTFSDNETVSIETYSSSNNEHQGVRSIAKLSVVELESTDVYRPADAAHPALQISEIMTVSKEELEISEASQESSVISTIISQKQEIAEIKKSLCEIQSCDAESSTEMVSKIRQRLDSVSEQIKAVEEPTVIIKTAPESDSMSTSDAQIRLKEAVETAEIIASKMLRAQCNVIDTQTDIVNQVSKATHSFLSDMDKEGGANTSEQSEFLRNVNSLAAHFGASTVNLKSEIDEANCLQKALETAKQEIENQEKIIASLRKEVMNLKMCKDAPRIALQVKQINDEIANIVSGDASKNQLFSNFRDATKVISSVMERAKTDNTVVAVGASSIVAKVSKMVDSANPDWMRIAAATEELTGAMFSGNARRRSEKMIKEVNAKNEQLLAENRKLRTRNAVAERDLTIVQKKAESELDQVKRSLAVALNQTAVLEKQLHQKTVLESSNALIAQQEFDNLKKEFEENQVTQSRHLLEIHKLTEHNNSLEKTVTSLNQQLDDMKQHYQTLFSQASDTQTSNQMLETRTAEIMRKAEIDSTKARTLEQMNNEVTAQLDTMTYQLQEAMKKETEAGKLLNEAETKIAALEAKLLESLANSGSLEVPRMIRLYQQKADDFQKQLAAKSNDITSLKAKRSEDVRTVLTLQREIQRAKNDLRLQIIRCEAAKSEHALAQRGIISRDETIRLLKREIERLRSLLSAQGPIKQALRIQQKQSNDNRESILRIKHEIKQAEQIAKNASGKATKSYMDDMLRRQKESLAKLEQRRKDIIEREEANRIAAMRAVSHVAPAHELLIPESVVLQMMPKPAPVKNLPKRIDVTESARSEHVIVEQAAPVYKAASYADALQQIGQLAGKVSPRTMHKMLRQALHNKQGTVTKKTREKAKEHVPEFSVTPIRTKK